ncbi:MAG: hypothetical protein ACFFCY_01290 [Promethearchaeota archaeon]
MKNETMNSLELCLIILFTLIGLISLMTVGISSNYEPTPMEEGAIFGGFCFIFVSFLIISFLVRNF